MTVEGSIVLTTHSILSVRLLSVILLASLSGCGMVRRVVADPPVIDCGPAQTRYCEAPTNIAGNSMLETEPEDVVNRSKWLVCVTDHRTLVDCLRALQSAGVIKGKEK